MRVNKFADHRTTSRLAQDYNPALKALRHNSINTFIIQLFTINFIL